ncbi:MAG: hypothetical protein IJT20_06500 [Synergistaceae bacterium]|nr:hypothetical protein [Synergistaceae bacterium]
MKRRKAETLAESIMSLAAFGVIMAGVCDFMSNQTNFIARTKHRDELMYYAQLYTNQHPDLDYVLESTDLGLSISRDKSNNILNVKKGTSEPITFSLPK